jgi:hypothetical protein
MPKNGLIYYWRNMSVVGGVWFDGWRPDAESGRWTITCLLLTCGEFERRDRF